jgi:hypothetical protein
MICEDVRPVLPELAGGSLREAGAAEVHLATCRACAEELAGYRLVVNELRGLRDVSVGAPEDLVDRLLAELPNPARPGIISRIAANDRVHQAAISLGGAVVGATAVGLLWWRVRRSPSSSSARVGAGA